MNRADIMQLVTIVLIFFPIISIYFFTKRSWYIRYDKGQGHYAQDPEYIYAHTFEGAKRKAKRIVERNDWNGFKLRPY